MLREGLALVSSTLAISVERLAHAIALLDERALETAVPEISDQDTPWNSYTDYPREIIFAAYQDLRELAIHIANERATTTPVTLAQHILGQHQLAYRDLTGALVGIRDDELDIVPAEGEWPLRTVIEHMLRAEFGFSLVIESALEQRGMAELKPAQFGAEEAMVRSQGMIQFSGDIASIRASFAEVHGHIQRSFSDLPDVDLDLPTLWWEERITPLRFRLQRFDAHLREHTIQIDKTILGISHTVTEGERLALLLHGALGECEAAALGAPNAASDRQQDVIRRLNAWADRLPHA